MAAQIVEPEVELPPAFSGGVFHTDYDHVDTVRVADELVVRHVVRLVPRELPETHTPHAFRHHTKQTQLSRTVKRSHTACDLP